MSKKKTTPKPKRRVIEHKPIARSRRQRLQDIRETLWELDDLEAQILAREEIAKS